MLFYFFFFSFFSETVFSKQVKNTELSTSIESSELSKKTDKKKSMIKGFKLKGLFSSSLRKEELLPHTYRSPKTSLRNLQRKFNQNLEEITSVCSDKKSGKTMLSKMNQFRHFLREELRKDSYMDTSMELLFRRVLMVIGQDLHKENLKSEEFRLKYKFGFNLSEDTTTLKYPHKWAMDIEEALLCIEEQSK